MEAFAFMANGERTVAPPLSTIHRARDASFPRYVVSGDREKLRYDGSRDRPLADRRGSTVPSVLLTTQLDAVRSLVETRYPLVRQGNIQAFPIVGATNQGRCSPGSGMWSVRVAGARRTRICFDM